MNRPDKKNKTLKTVVTALIFCGFFVMAGFLAIPEAYADTSNYIYSGSGDDTVRKIDSSGNEVWTFDGHSSSVMDVAVDSDGYVYSGSVDDTVRKIDPSGNQVWTFDELSNRVYSVAVDSDGYVYSASRDDTLRKIDSSGNEVWSYDHNSWVRAVAVDSDGYVYSGSSDEKVRKIDPSGNEVWTFDGHSFYVNDVAVDSDGYVYSASSDNTFKKIDSSGNEVWSFDDHSSSVLGVAVDSYDDEAEHFDGFEAITKPADPYSLNEYVLASEVLNFGNYDFEASDNHLAQGVKVFDEDGQVIHEPAMNIINDFETPADFSTVFEAEPGETYGYQWRYYYIDYITGETIDIKLTPLEVFTHEVDEEAPELETLNAQDVADTSAELGGRVSSLGAYESLEISFEWVEAGGEEWNETDPVATVLDILDNSEPPTFWYILDNLEPATTYYYRIKADEYRGNRVSFTTAEETIDDPEEPAPVDWEDWQSFYDLESDQEFDNPVGVIDGIGTTFDGIMGSIINRIQPFRERLETDQAYSHGREAGDFIPTMRGYLIELRPFFGGLPVAEVFVFFLIFQIVILAIKGVMIALGFLPFF